jgi:crooked neck
VKMETRYKEWERVRKVYERYAQCHPSVKAWVRWAKFEMGLGEVGKAREVYGAAVEAMEHEVDVDQLYVKFAQFEELCKEHDRARAIYKYALDNLPKDKATGVYQSFMTFEKQHGDREVGRCTTRIQFTHSVKAIGTRVRSSLLTLSGNTSLTSQAYISTLERVK